MRTISSAPLEKLVLKTVDWNVIIITVAVVVFDDDTYCCFTSPTTIHFKFFTKCDKY